MGTRELSKIKHARKPARGDHYPCTICAEPIRPGDEYFCWQLGQRSSDAVCMDCIRTPGRAPVGALRLYVDRYGVRSS